MDRVLTVSGVAEVLDCHIDTVRNLNRRGILKARRNCHGWRVFRLEDVLTVKRERAKLREENEMRA